MDRNRLMNVIGTGLISGALIIVAMVFSNSNPFAATAANSDTPAMTETMTEELAAQNAELQEALTLMQAREAEYQAKLEEANNMLLNPPEAAYGDEAYEEEYEEYEEDEDEEEEYDEYEEDEDDDDDEYEEDDEDEDEAYE